MKRNGSSFYLVLFLASCEPVSFSFLAAVLFAWKPLGFFVALNGLEFDALLVFAWGGTTLGNWFLCGRVMLLCLSAGRRFTRSSSGGMAGFLDLSGASLTPLWHNFLFQFFMQFLSSHVGCTNPPNRNTSVLVSFGLSILAATARCMSPLIAGFFSLATSSSSACACRLSMFPPDQQVRDQWESNPKV